MHHPEGLREFTPASQPLKRWLPETEWKKQEDPIAKLKALIVTARVTKFEIIAGRVFVKSQKADRRASLVCDQRSAMAMDLGKWGCSYPNLAAVVWSPLWVLVEPLLSAPSPASCGPAVLEDVAAASGAVSVVSSAGKANKGKDKAKDKTEKGTDKKDKDKKDKKTKG